MGETDGQLVSPGETARAHGIKAATTSKMRLFARAV